MLHTAKTLKGFQVEATDREVGAITDVFIDDAAWVVRYLVVDSGKWLRRHEVLITPLAVRDVDEPAERVRLSMSRARVEQSPALDAHPPVSRQHEAAYFDYLGYPYYWGVGYPRALDTPPPVITVEHQAELDVRVEDEKQEAAARGDQHLRSAMELRGYSVHATDGDLGHIEDFLIDGDTWTVRYVVVDTKNWWLDNFVVIPPGWITDVLWARRGINVDVRREDIREAPEYRGRVDLEREWEERYHSHFGRRGYWREPDQARGIEEAAAHVRNQRS